MQTTTISGIKEQVKDLPREQKADLIKYLADLLTDKPAQSKMIEFGKYADSGRPMSTEEDFKIAEWHPTERLDLNP